MTLLVKGGRFVQGSVLYADGVALPTVWQTEDSLSASLPKEMAANPGALQLQVRVIDSQEHVLVQSPNYTLPITPKKP
jgi:hypothetical protein